MVSEVEKDVASAEESCGGAADCEGNVDTAPVLKDISEEDQVVDGPDNDPLTDLAGVDSPPNLVCEGDGCDVKKIKDEVEVQAVEDWKPEDRDKEEENTAASACQDAEQPTDSEPPSKEPNTEIDEIDASSNSSSPSALHIHLDEEPAGKLLK